MLASDVFVFPGQFLALSFEVLGCIEFQGFFLFRLQSKSLQLLESQLKVGCFGTS